MLRSLYGRLFRFFIDMYIYDKHDGMMRLLLICVIEIVLILQGLE